MPATLNTPKLTVQLTTFEDTLLVRTTATSGEAKVFAPLPSPELLIPFSKPDKTPPRNLTSIGKTLFTTLFRDQTGQLAIDVLEAGRQANQPVQVELHFDADQILLAQFPWELLVDEAGQFLVREGRVDLTRYINYPQPPPVFDISLANKQLLELISTPPQLPFIYPGDLPVERLEILEHASFEKLMFRLLIDRLALWGVQFNGYGGMVKQCNQCETANPPMALICTQCQSPLTDGREIAALAFERNGAVDWVSTKDFGETLYNAQVQLVHYPGLNFG